MNLSLLRLAKILDSKKLYSLADKVDRIAQNNLSFKTDQEAIDYINSLVGKMGITSFAQAMDSAANQGVNVNNISIKNIPQFQAKYKESAPKMPMMPGMPMPVAPMPVMPMPMNVQSLRPQVPAPAVIPAVAKTTITPFITNKNPTLGVK